MQTTDAPLFESSLQEGVADVVQDIEMEQTSRRERRQLRAQRNARMIAELLAQEQARRDIARSLAAASSGSSQTPVPLGVPSSFSPLDPDQPVSAPIEVDLEGKGAEKRQAASEDGTNKKTKKTDTRKKTKSRRPFFQGRSKENKKRKARRT